MSQIKLLSMINFGKLECLCGVREPSVIYVNAYLNSNRSSQLTAQHLMISTNVNDNVCLVIYSVLVSTVYAGTDLLLLFLSAAVWVS